MQCLDFQLPQQPPTWPSICHRIKAHKWNQTTVLSSIGRTSTGRACKDSLPTRWPGAIDWAQVSRNNFSPIQVFVCVLRLYSKRWSFTPAFVINNHCLLWGAKHFWRLRSLIIQAYRTNWLINLNKHSRRKAKLRDACGNNNQINLIR